MRHIFLAFVVGCAIMTALSLPARAESVGSAPPPKLDFTVLLYFENDLFYGEDRYYTNAVQARFISPDLRTLTENGFLPESFSKLLEEIPFPGSDDATQYNISLGFGQQIYTPADTQLNPPLPDDRPYAGYLYGLFALHAKQRNRLDTLELAAGIIGPSALGEQAQNEIHRIKGVDTSKGWDYQLADEPALMLTWVRTWRVNTGVDAGKGWGWDLLPHVGLSLGSPFTQASLGGEVRFGWNLPSDFGSLTIRPGAGIYAPQPRGDCAVPPAPGNSFWNNTSVYVFVGCEGRAVAYNTFLDGNIWHDSASVDKFPLVGDLMAGVGLKIHDLRLTYTHIYRSQEFHGQDSGQSIGSITVGYTF